MTPAVYGRKGYAYVVDAYNGVGRYNIKQNEDTVRPVLNIKGNSHIIGGNGTSDDPYILKY